MRKIDLTGMKFGKWKVLRYSKCVPGSTLWICQCNCGKISLIASNDLRYGKTTQCNQCYNKEKFINLSKLKTIDETGNKYGRLVVIEKVKSDKNNQARWKCLCDCGNETIVLGNSLRMGRTKSCGCLRSEYLKSTQNPMKNPEIKKKFIGKNNPSYGIIRHSKGEWYTLPNWNTFWIRSSYEKRAIYMLLISGIKFEYEPRCFKLMDKTYTPDIYLVDYDIWWEIKGYMRPKEKIKMKEFITEYDDINIKIVTNDDLNEMQENIIQDCLNIRNMGASLEEYLKISEVKTWN